MTSRTQRRAGTRFEPGPWRRGSDLRPQHGALALSGRRTVTALLLPVLMSLTAAAAATEQPNIVILFADDLGYGSVSWYGGQPPGPKRTFLLGVDKPRLRRPEMSEKGHDS